MDRDLAAFEEEAQAKRRSGRPPTDRVPRLAPFRTEAGTHIGAAAQHWKYWHNGYQI
jgi:hypothetical protein